MKKQLTAFLATLILVFLFTGCGGGASGGEASSGGTSGEVDPFDPAIFNVEEGGIVFNYQANYNRENKIDIEIENQLPEDDIRSTFKYKIVADESWELENIAVGDIVTIEVTAPDEFWEENEMTTTDIEFTIPPVPAAAVTSELITDEVWNEHLSEITEGLKEVIEGKYYNYESDGNGGKIEHTGSVKDLIDTENIYFVDGDVYGQVKEPDEDGNTLYVELGQVYFSYNQNKELVATFCHETCDASGEQYYTRNEDHMIPLTDHSCLIVTYAEDDVSYADELSPSDRYLNIEFFSSAEPEVHTYGYSYNYNTGELTSLSE